MAITKTKFINLIRCKRYAALEEIKENELKADVTYEEYRREENEELLSEMIQNVYDSMFDEDGESVIDVVDASLETLMPYYKEIELIADEHVKGKLKGNTKASLSNFNQESFDFVENGIKYLCYVDIYNERDDAFDIVEVKATTSRQFLDVGCSVDKEFVSIFEKDSNGIYCLKEDLGILDMPEKKYYEQRKKLMDKYKGPGHYVYDLLVQRMIIENDLKQHGDAYKIGKIKYYLAVLNGDYSFDGKYENGKPVYGVDQNGNEIISMFDFTSLTKELLEQVENDRLKIVEYLDKIDASPCQVGIFCEHKKRFHCKYLPVCFYKKVPKYNSILNYMGSHNGFKDDLNFTHMPFDLINDGIVKMIDINKTWLTRQNNIIQREVLDSGKPYYNYKKMKDGIYALAYPLYHLDFESFPCPLPRFSGEKCYSQSVFQFSLHIEREPGVCDIDKDHFEFLATTHDDMRLDLVKKLCEYIDTSKGNIIAYNQGFEKSRIKELAEIFPEYRTKLMKMTEMLFDLMYIVKSSGALYQDLGYDKEEASVVNFYHEKLNGSYSIKKVLPIFAPELDYSKLDIGNGNEALITYAKFPTMNRSDFENKKRALLYYCKQDTWAMVLILDALRKVVKS